MKLHRTNGMERIQAVHVFIILLLVYFLSIPTISSQGRHSARNFRTPLDGFSGLLDATTGGRGLEIAQTPVVFGKGKLDVRTAPISTGVAMLLPLRKSYLRDPAKAVAVTIFSLNGSGEISETILVEEFG